MPELVYAVVTDEPIHIQELSKLVANPHSGAVVTFCGDVRDHDGGKEVAALLYEIHPSAPEQIKLITQSVIGNYVIEKVAVAHRFGDIAIGETAFAVAVSAAHRQAAFDACSAIVDEVKAKLPIWKHQKFTDGTDEWVNCA
ncbi:MAG: molybdenum cofactor biosynthesis protein MoaE [Actinobacteria bacterium]|jgi:molybdopterin synthase catalytic subunit|nr:molybdenum cofactor biosynthesis protein MoaE [Actinomycetota bacterium]NCV42236.1 molybdenum cofactor biosynthesis protein MoaE [Actinomycetota bacterium]NCW42723.1 molybdenum cofactor biosynthesis protein MoaE [Actinomycetota bacterium]NCW71942.1 molybdenum cofactor biosynthesis protein MoaE [Actinomycetota bacterium]NCW92454.1 molybdenum cofactor biosynthesis protein MoaE [Actinomycetota bacterium]